MTICKFIKDEKQTSPNLFIRKLYGQFKVAPTCFAFS